MTASVEPIVRVAGGRLAGRREGLGAVFRGIPFAAPPVGPLRWRPPAPATSWAGVRPADRSGPAPMQPQPPRDTPMWHANFADRDPLVMSEDCLYLDVHTPDPTPGAGLPVLVWVQGGGNRFGYGSQDIHDGTAFAAAGIVVVTLNYRLGALGWLVHPGLAAEADGAAGNYGMMDILAALRWVRANIAAFGGDPDRVTAAGNSAGAVHLCHLMAVPAARGLFRAVIGQSSSGIGRADGALPTVEAAGQVGLRYAKEFGDFAALRRRSALEVTAVGHFGPVLDGALLTEQTDDVFAAGRQTPVPLLVGNNADEGSFYATAQAAAQLRERATGFGPDHPFHAVYPTGSPEQVRGSARRWVGDTRFTWPVWHWARTHAAAGPSVWLYHFARQPPLPTDLDLAAPRDGGAGYGVFHTVEVAYAWNSLTALSWPWRAQDRAVAAAMNAAWAEFVHHGDPNGPVAPRWPALDPAAPVTMIFGTPLGAAPDPDAASRRLHDGFASGAQ